MDQVRKKPIIKITASTVMLCMCAFYPALRDYMRRVIAIPFWAVGIDLTYELFDILVWSIVLVGIVLTAKKYVIGIKPLLCYLAFVMVAMVSFAATSYDYFSASVLLKLVFQILPFLMYGSLVQLERVSRKQLYVMAVITLMISLAYSLYSVDAKELELEDNMDFAYKILPSVLIIISRLFTKEKKTLATIFAVIGVIFLVLQGTRGPLLCLAIFLGLMFYKKFGMGRLVIIVSTVAVVVSLLLGSEGFQTTLLDITKKIDKTGYSSRFIVMMMEDELTDANGRDAIQEKLLKHIQENPLAVRGLYADRQATRGLHDQEYTTTYDEGTYAHNIAIELVFDFGIIIGGLLFLCIGVAILRLIKNCDKDTAYIVMLFVCVGFVKLLLSSSYLRDSDFFFLLGLCMVVKQQKALSKSADSGTASV